MRTSCRAQTWCCEWTTGTIGCRTTLWPSGCEIKSSRTDVEAVPQERNSLDCDARILLSGNEYRVSAEKSHAHSK